MDAPLISSDILVEVLRHLHGSDCIQILEVCKQWREECDRQRIVLRVLSTASYIDVSPHKSRDVHHHEGLSRICRVWIGTSIRQRVWTRVGGDYPVFTCRFDVETPTADVCAQFTYGSGIHILEVSGEFRGDEHTRGDETGMDHMLTVTCRRTIPDDVTFDGTKLARDGSDHDKCVNACIAEMFSMPIYFFHDQTPWTFARFRRITPTSLEHALERETL